MQLFALLFDTALKSVLIVMLAYFLAFVLRKYSAAARYAVWAAAEIAVRQVADAASNAPLRNRSFFRSPSFLRKVGRRCQAGQTFHIFTASECGHVVSR